ncbi:unnamed protein product [Gordionus sp. m RMFG-2023]
MDKILAIIIDKFYQTRFFFENKISNPNTRKLYILLIVCLALFLDNMLYMVIVPIIPDYLHHLILAKGIKKDIDKKSSFITNPNASIIDETDFKKGALNQEFSTTPEYEYYYDYENVTDEESTLNTKSKSIIETIKNNITTILNTKSKSIIKTLRNNITTMWNQTQIKLADKLKIIPLPPLDTSNEAMLIGVLFASKAIFQLFVNPFSGAIIDRLGYDRPLLFGLLIMFLSTVFFAFAKTYGGLFFARSLQGLGSAFADTSGLAMIADQFPIEAERTKALGWALACISLGSLIAPPFGGILYQFVGKKVPFLVLSVICLIDGMLLIFIMKDINKKHQEYRKSLSISRGNSLRRKSSRKNFDQTSDYSLNERKHSIKNIENTWMNNGDLSNIPPIKPTPIYKLLMDPYIVIVAGALSMSNVCLAFLEPTIAVWMKETMNSSEWQIGVVWLFGFPPHIIGVYLTVKLAKNYPKYQWFIAAIGLAIEGVSSFLVPLARTYWALIIPISGMCFGIALVDTALLPTLGYIVDLFYVSIYGSVYAIADISYCLAYAFGPILAGRMVNDMGFLNMNIGIALSNIMYAPLLILLKNIYKYRPIDEYEDNEYDQHPLQPSYMDEESDTLTNKPYTHYNNLNNINRNKYEDFEDSNSLN